MPAKPVKVCFVAPKAYSLFNPEVDAYFGGAEVDLYFLATELARDKDFAVSFIVADYAQPAVETIENVTVIKSLDFRSNQLISAQRIWKALRRADADVYMLKTASPGVPLTAGFCRLHRRAFVYRTAHQRECDGTYLKEHSLLGRAFAASLRSAKIIFAQNAADAEALKKTVGVDSTVIPNGHRMPPSSAEERDSVLWVGRTADFKRPELFLALAEQFPEEKFVMICRQATGDDNYEDFCSRVGGVNNIEFHRQVPFGQIDSFFQKARVFVNTSSAEGFPNTFIQACKAAVPILSLNVNPDDFLNKYFCGIACRGDQSRLTESLKFMLDSNRYIELGQNARDYIEQNHDIAKIIEKYKNTFRQIQADL